MNFSARIQPLSLYDWWSSYRSLNSYRSFPIHSEAVCKMVAKVGVEPTWSPYERDLVTRPIADLYLFIKRVCRFINVERFHMVPFSYYRKHLDSNQDLERSVRNACIHYTMLSKLTSLFSGDKHLVPPKEHVLFGHIQSNVVTCESLVATQNALSQWSMVYVINSLTVMS